MSLTVAAKSLISLNWRRGRDSNPRYPCRYSAFRVRRDRPLCHLSAVARRKAGSQGAMYPSPRSDTRARAALQFAAELAVERIGAAAAQGDDEGQHPPHQHVFVAFFPPAIAVVPVLHEG